MRHSFLLARGKTGWIDQAGTCTDRKKARMERGLTPWMQLAEWEDGITSGDGLSFTIGTYLLARFS